MLHPGPILSAIFEFSDWLPSNRPFYAISLLEHYHLRVINKSSKQFGSETRKCSEDNDDFIMLYEQPIISNGGLNYTIKASNSQYLE